MENSTIILKQRIRDKGLKQSWVADKIGVNISTFYAYMNGERNLPQHVSDSIKELID